jgi:outer membrane receptor protein involved in Fe transport
MKNRLVEERPRPLQTDGYQTQCRLLTLLGLGFAVAIFAATWASAEPPDPATAGVPESQNVSPEPSDESDPEAKPSDEAESADGESANEESQSAETPNPKRPSMELPNESDIEDIVILGTQSDATGDFSAADAVTSFGDADLAALGMKDIADLSAYTPNLEIVTYGATTPTFFIRGVGLNQFDPISTGAVAVYWDDVAMSMQAIQLAPLFDIETVNVLKGPQGTGLARNASAGAIKVYTNKPVGDFGASVSSEFGNFDSRDFQGFVEMPMVADMLSGRFAFRLTQRDGTMKNRCGNAPPIADRVENPGPTALRAMGLKSSDPPWSICGEPVQYNPLRTSFSDIPVDLPDRVNNLDNWGARGTLLFEPTATMSWLFSAHGSRRDELSRLGQAYGTNGFYCLDGNIDDCYPGSRLYPNGSRITNVLGGTQGISADSYQTREVQQRLEELAPCWKGVPGSPQGTCNQTGPQQASNRAMLNAARLIVAQELAQHLDSRPWAGDFNICSPDKDVDPLTPGVQCDKDAGKTKNDTWGGYLTGELDLPREMHLTSTTSYDTYNRYIDQDLDFSPETLFHIETVDDGWQVAQDLKLQGQFDDEGLARWEVGGWFLRAKLHAMVTNDLGDNALFGVGKRTFTQDLWSTAGYLSLSFDFWDDFTLDGGFRYNWEQKKLDFVLVNSGPTPYLQNLDNTWSAPTGTVRLTYRFRGDTHVFWKYTRGWKPGTYNATSSLLNDFFTKVSYANVSVAKPEKIDAFETGVSGSWFDDRVNLDVSFFYYAYHNYQIFTAQQYEGGQPEFVILNANDAEVYGADLETAVRPWTGALLNVRFGWLESQFLDFVQLQQEHVLLGNQRITANRELQNTGNSLLNSPRFKVSISAEQEVPIGSWGSLIARYDGVWTDTTYYDATNGLGIPNVQNLAYLPPDTIGQPAYWLHNLRLAYRTPDQLIEVAGWVRNLTNKAYKTFAFDGSTFNNTTIYFVGDPRTYGITATVNF